MVYFYWFGCIVGGWCIGYGVWFGVFVGDVEYGFVFGIG